MDSRLEAQWLEDLPETACKNKELWQRLDAAVENHDVQWHWVKGHSGHVENERVDQAANEAIDLMQAQS